MISCTPLHGPLGISDSEDFDIGANDLAERLRLKRDELDERDVTEEETLELDTLGKTLGATVADRLRDELGDALLAADGLGEAMDEATAEEAGLAEGLTDGLGEGLDKAEGDGLAEGKTLGDILGDALADGLVDELGDGLDGIALATEDAALEANGLDTGVTDLADERIDEGLDLADDLVLEELGDAAGPACRSANGKTRNICPAWAAPLATVTVAVAPGGSSVMS